MSYDDGWAAVNLEMPSRVPRFEADASYHWPLVRTVTGIEVGVESPPEGCSLESVPGDAAWSKEWTILMQGPETAPRLYANDVFR